MIEQLKSFLAVTPQELKQPTILKQKDDVFYLLLNTKANAFTYEFVRQIHKEIDKVEAHSGATTLVTTSLSKLFSGGLNLKVTSNLAPQEQRYFILQFIGLIGRISVLPFPTIALVRGGAAAGGCMLAFAHDFVYVGGKAKFSTKEAQLQMYFPPGMMAVVKKRHPYPSTMRDMIIFSKEFEAEEALNLHLIDKIFKEEEALETTQTLAQNMSEFGMNKANMGRIKCELYKSLTDNCFNQQMIPSKVNYTLFPAFPKL